MRFDDILRASLISLFFLLLMMISFNNVSYGCENPEKRGSFTVCTDSQKQLTQKDLYDLVMKYISSGKNSDVKCFVLIHAVTSTYDSNNCKNSLNNIKPICDETFRTTKDVAWNDLIGYCQNLE